MRALYGSVPDLVRCVPLMVSKLNRNPFVNAEARKLVRATISDCSDSISLWNTLNFATALKVKIPTPTSLELTVIDNVFSCIFRPIMGVGDEGHRRDCVWLHAMNEYVSELNDYKGPKVTENAGNYPNYREVIAKHVMMEMIGRQGSKLKRKLLDVMNRQEFLGLDTRLSVNLWALWMCEEKGYEDGVINILDLILPRLDTDQKLLGKVANIIGAACRFTCEIASSIAKASDLCKKGVRAVEFARRCRYIGELACRGDYGIDIVGELLTRIKHGPARMYIRNLDELPIKNEEAEIIWVKNNRMDALEKECIEETLEEFMFGESPNKETRQTESWRDFWDDRFKWIATGSAPGFKMSRTNAISGKVEKISTNKRFAIVKMPEKQCLEIIKHRNMAVSWARWAIKYENRKSRSLWNSSMGHYVISSRILNTIEWHGTKPRWAHAYANSLDVADNECMMLELSKNQAIMIHELIQSNNEITDDLDLMNVPLMWDFSDFNVNHKLDSMAHIWLYSSQRLERIRPGEMYAECGMWLAEATMNAVMENQHSDMLRNIATLIWLHMETIKLYLEAG